MAVPEWLNEFQAAESYERFLVPALFDQWAPRMLDAADLTEGDRVLDVACGTGIVARHAAKRVGPSGTAIGLDVSDAMLKVAERIEPEVEWRLGDAATLPFSDASFDSVICQSGLMFMPDQTGALQEMKRVLRPGGRLAIQVWAPCEAQDVFARIVEEFAGRVVADGYRTPWNLRDPVHLLSVVHAGGFPQAILQTEPGWASYPSIDAFLAGVKGILIPANVIDDGVASATTRAFDRYLRFDGTLTFSEPGHVVTATRS